MKSNNEVAGKINKEIISLNGAAKDAKDKVEALVDKMMNNTVCGEFIHTEGNEFEVPGVAQLGGNWWKGKADIVNHKEKLVIDLKTTADLAKFHWSAKKYNYDSQAFVYKNLFGYDMLFIAIDKNTGQIGIFDCTDEFLSNDLIISFVSFNFTATALSSTFLENFVRSFLTSLISWLI